MRVGQIGDHAEIVLDHQHGAVGGDRLDQRADAVDVLVAHAGRRLVEQQHFGIERQRGGDLERALAAIGQFHRRPIGQNADRPTSAISAIARSLKASSTRLERQKSNEPPRWRCSAMRTFSSTVRCGNTAEIWNERTSPSRATSAGASAVMSRPLKTMRPRVGCEEFGQQIEAGGLAGAVRPDQRMNGAARDPQIDAVDRDESGKFLGQILGFEDDVIIHRRANPLCGYSLPVFPNPPAPGGIREGPLGSPGGHGAGNTPPPAKNVKGPAVWPPLICGRIGLRRVGVGVGRLPFVFCWGGVTIHPVAAQDRKPPQKPPVAAAPALAPAAPLAPSARGATCRAPASRRPAGCRAA